MRGEGLKALIGVLREVYGELDAAVAEAYGWEPGLSKERVLEKLVALNEERRAEEEQGLVRYLRPEYQAPEEAQAQAALELDVEVQTDGAPAKKLDWPKTLAERAQAVQQVVHSSEEPLTVEEVAKCFRYARREQVLQLLETLDTLGLVRAAGDGAYAG